LVIDDSSTSGLGYSSKVDDGGYSYGFSTIVSGGTTGVGSDSSAVDSG